MCASQAVRGSSAEPAPARIVKPAQIGDGGNPEFAAELIKAAK